MSRSSEPVLDVLKCIRRRFRIARVLALFVGPFGGMVGYSMQSVHGPSFTSYPKMLGHARSIKAFDDPDGTGDWINVIGEAQSLFAERESWELYHLFRYERLANTVWWIAFTLSVFMTVGFLCAENTTVGFPLLGLTGFMISVSVAGVALSRPLVGWNSKRTRLAYERVTSELPARLWSVIDTMRERLANNHATEITP